MLLNNKYEYNPQTDLLGSGGFGNVFKAKDTVLNRDVALKLVDKNNLPARYSLVAEMGRVIELQHSNLVRFYDAFIYKATDSMGRETEVQVGVMEYINNGDLTKFCGRPYDIPDLNTFLRGILEGLGYLHSKGIIHRDIKPANIMIKKEGNILIPKISDFGISKNISDAGSTVSGVVGSQAYMAPELLNNTSGKLSPSCDIWAFGILLYELFTGERPFDQPGVTSNVQIITNIIECRLPEKVNSIPEPYQTIIKACVYKDLKQRVSSTDGVLAMLDFTGGQNIINNDATPVETMHESVSRPPSLPSIPNNDATIVEKQKSVGPDYSSEAFVTPPPLPVSSYPSVPPLLQTINSYEGSNVIGNGCFDINTNVVNKPRMFKNIWSSKGRIQKMEYRISLVIIILINLVLFSFIFINDQKYYGYFTSLFYDNYGNNLATFMILFVFFFIWLPQLWFAIEQGVKRCHDMGHSGWYQLIPFYFFVMLFGNGEHGVNKYGSNPK